MNGEMERLIKQLWTCRPPSVNDTGHHRRADCRRPDGGHPGRQLVGVPPGASSSLSSTPHHKLYVLQLKGNSTLSHQRAAGVPACSQLSTQL